MKVRQASLNRRSKQHILQISELNPHVELYPKRNIAGVHFTVTRVKGRMPDIYFLEAMEIENLYHSLMAARKQLGL